MTRGGRRSPAAAAALALLLATAGCGLFDSAPDSQSPQDQASGSERDGAAPGDEAGEAAPATAPGVTPAGEPVMAGSDEGLPAGPGEADLTLTEQTPKLKFEWIAPRAILSEPKLLQSLRADAERDLAEAREAAAAEEQPNWQHSYHEDWKVTAETSDLLALEASFDMFTGGAHGMQGYDATVWDKTADKRLDAGKLFTRAADAWKELTPAYCEALDAERARKREGLDFGKGLFDDCPDIEEQTVALMAPAGGASGPVTRLRILLAPYTAGPYAEGSYEVTLPVTAALLALIKPDYAESFALPGD